MKTEEKTKVKKEKLNEIISKLNEKDREKLKSIYDSLETNSSFSSWVYVLFYEKNLLPVMSMGFFISELLMIISMNNHMILSTIVLFLICLLSTIILIGIDSFLTRMPFFFYMKIKLKILLLKISSTLS
ncbi:hypothetical protein AB7179_15005 [Providencia manganoxydans]|uniref:hypothetical protein n=1 Tax=Providencia manganoxydans TaxID=2923283 RepID=UPI0034E48C5B